MDKLILHIDMNSYFASVEQQANPFLRGKPIGITGKSQERSVITTASIEAKALGVKTAMPTWEAKKVCPNLILWTGDPEKYSDVMDRFNSIYASFTHIVEPFSVDESFLDLTETAEDYLGATFIAQMIRERLREELGERITASIGIGPNKLIAKLASGRIKPNGLTVVRPQDVLSFLNTVELDDMCGIGPRILKRLRNLGIETFQQLREYPREDLEIEFQNYGTWLHEAAYGRDSSVISSPTEGHFQTRHNTDTKSYGHSYTLPQNTSDTRILKRYLFGLADKVAWRMRRDGVVAHRVHAFARFGDFSGHGEQRTFHESTADGMKLFKMAWTILEPAIKNRANDFQETVSRRSGLAPSLDNRGGSPKPRGAGRRRSDQAAFLESYSRNGNQVRLLGISASKLVGDSNQPSLFKKERNIQSVLCALDSLQSRYGSGVWKRGSTLSTEFKTRSSGFHFDHEV